MKNRTGDPAARLESLPARDTVADEREWRELLAYGQERARALGLTEADLPRLIAEVRQERREDARPEALLLEGLASKRLPLDGDFWKRVEAKTEATIERHSTRKAT